MADTAARMLLEVPRALRRCTRLRPERYVMAALLHAGLPWHAAEWRLRPIMRVARALARRPSRL